MKTSNQTEVYSQLHGSLCQDRAMPDIDWHKFIERTDIVQVKKKEVFVKSGEPSTHSYFIISGLIMCQAQIGPKDHIYWFRAENDYAFCSHNLPYGSQQRDNREALVALEDTVAVRISHADLQSLMKDNPQITIMYGNVFTKTTITFSHLVNRGTRDPQYDYEYVQKHIGFNLDRVPDVYLATYLGTTVKKLKDVREAIKK